MDFTFSTVPITLVLFAAMLALLEVGRRFGARRPGADRGGAGIATIEASVFGLMGLLIAFTFSGASSRFEARRALIVEEANAIGTAWLRLELIPAGAQPALRQLFRSYLDARLETYRSLADQEASRAIHVRAVELQTGIWTTAVAACREPGMQQATMLLLPALNEMIDIVTTRSMATQFHQPSIIFAVLVLLALAASLLAGYGIVDATQRRWIPMIGFAAFTTLAIYVIIDLEYPRYGLIRVDAADQVLVDLRQTMD